MVAFLVSSDCYCYAALSVGLQRVIVVIPDHILSRRLLFRRNAYF